ncbi:MAG: glucose 1-dehydrogenase [Bdellovibrionales bacterium]|nr:glucose 1-dehydrogenase [Bdellovibrionales bacterium]
MTKTPEKRLAGKVAILTGAAKGIGADIARAYAAAGARVVVNYRESGAAASSLCEEIAKAGGEAFAIQADITDADSVAKLVDGALERFGRIDVLVNNAAAYRYGLNAEITRESFREQFETNVLGALFMVQSVAPHLPSGGRVINLSSISATSATPGLSLYAGTKAALNEITRILAAELGPRGVTVNAIAPGSTATATNAWLDDAKRATVISRTALGRIGTGEDMAAAAVFLASREAEFITGQVLTIDGGYFG